MTHQNTIKAYCGDSRKHTTLATMSANNVGQCIIRGKLNGRRLDDWFYDNGAFLDHKNGRAFDACTFERDLRRIDMHSERGEMVAPAFVVLPDLVMGGLESLDVSLDWLAYLQTTHSGRAQNGKYYLAVQNGMVPSDLEGIDWELLGGLFVGGSMDWKLETMAEWAELAHRMGKKCHVGQIGTVERVELADLAGVDSVDSCAPMWNERKLEKFIDAISKTTTTGQLELFEVAA